jgi:hydroxymethylbilane synthase
MVQARYIGDLILRSFPEIKVEIKPIKTTGDKILGVPLARIGGKGLFTKEIEEELLSGGIDMAVHSLKDLPTELPEGLMIGAVPKREDPRDVLVSGKASTIGALPQGAKVGTSSLRRKTQILHLRRDLTVLDLRGNVDTRVAKLRGGAYDAIILASAGIKRLGLDLERSEISVEEILPQAGQGALGIEVREDARAALEIVKAFDDSDSRLAVVAERALLARLEGGCQVPVGVYACIAGGMIDIRAGVFSLDGSEAEKAGIEGPKKEARELGEALAEKMLENGTARRLLEEYRKER